MVPIETEEKILELAKLLPSKKITIKQIATQTETSRCTIYQIINVGKVRQLGYERKTLEKFKEKNWLKHKKDSPLTEKPNAAPADRPPTPSIAEQSPHVKYSRCSCGRFVQLPCLACWLESHQNV